MLFYPLNAEYVEATYIEDSLVALVETGVSEVMHVGHGAIILVMVPRAGGKKERWNAVVLFWS